MQISQILVPTDFSSCSAAALRQALHIAESFDAKLTVLHTWRLPPYVSPELAIQISRQQPGTNLQTVAEADLTEEMKIFVDRITKGNDDRVTTKLVHGSREETILEHAKAHDLIIIGTHGRTGLDRMMMGSVAKKLIRRSPVPVLSVRATPKTPTLPLRVLVAVDFSDEARRAVEVATEFAAKLGAEIHFLHVMESVAQLSGGERFISWLKGDSISAIEEHARAHAEEEIALFLSNMPGHKIGKVVSILGEPHQEIVKLAEAEKYALIVQGARGKGKTPMFELGTVAEKVVRASHVPVLTVHSVQRPKPSDPA